MRNALFAQRRPRNHQVRQREGGGGNRATEGQQNTQGRTQTKFTRDHIPALERHVRKQIGGEHPMASRDLAVALDAIKRRHPIPTDLINRYEGLHLSPTVKAYQRWQGERRSTDD